MTATRRRGLLAGTLLTVLALSATGAAFAYMTGSGFGSGTATTGTTKPVTLSPGTAADQLYPGGVSAVAVTVANPNPGAVKVGSLALDASLGTGGFAVDAGHAACGVASLAFTTQTNGTAGWTIPAVGSTALSLASSLSMTVSAVSACQGASFTVYLKVDP
jgi:hypothetical protein